MKHNIDLTEDRDFIYSVNNGVRMRQMDILVDKIYSFQDNFLSSLNMSEYTRYLFDNIDKVCEWSI